MNTYKILFIRRSQICIWRKFFGSHHIVKTTYFLYKTWFAARVCMGI
nr:MAG TPA: hypothetical protein [Caudoviricetes sp.]